jgi:hypothetical protein
MKHKHRNCKHQNKPEKSGNPNISVILFRMCQRKEEETAEQKKRRQHKQQRAAKVERRNERSNVSCEQTKEPRETTFSENSKLTDHD